MKGYQFFRLRRAIDIMHVQKPFQSIPIISIQHYSTKLDQRGDMLGQRNHNIDDGAIFLWIKQYEEQKFHLRRATHMMHIIEKNAHFLRQGPRNNRTLLNEL